MSTSELIADAWKVAAADLGFTFICPFELVGQGTKVRYAGLVKEFGSDKGMLLFCSENYAIEPWASCAERNGYGYSCLSWTYENYDRESFIDALNDWGWTSKDCQPPAWYTGQPWTS